MSYPQQPPPYLDPRQGPPGGYPGRNHPQAATSLILGILSLVLCGFFTGIPAMVIGRKATREIRESRGALGGEGLATAGFITGALGTLVTGLATGLVVLVFVFGGVLSNVFEQTCNSVGPQGHHQHQATC